MSNKDARRFPIISLGAEHLVIGSLMRRNILAYKAPPNNEGYDLICIHPDPRKCAKQIRVQVKSRYQTDCDRAFPVKARSFDAFDYVIIVFLNNGFYYRKKPIREGFKDPEYYTLPAEIIRQNHHIANSGWERVETKDKDLDRFKNERGFEIIAQDLGIAYPGTDGVA
ncbi:hypothetical protein [Nitrosomonas ureae]|uniref:PD(D/E)XK endonuclease domain-containing protein n=1 Tax=Nitrosomonas ureae TaxID=44577 RepID=A0A286A461_9PROT|nr:hypothetical protein [Nitrosomonas ureae]SOD16693.1 hypothetical protein SAMN06297164_0701 [Nitrosomonas ureae]